MAERYLVTGCAGFIASKVSELLLDAGHLVVGVDNINDAYDPRLKRWRLEQLEPRENFRFQRLDITDQDALGELFRAAADEADAEGRTPQPYSAVINLAARAGVRPSVEKPKVYYETNSDGTLNLLELCRRFGVGKFVLASTSSLYGEHNAVPFREDADTSRPLSPYAASKKAAETLAYTYHYLHGLDVSILRYFTVYGPAGRPDMSIFRFVRRIAEGEPIVVFGDGRQSRDFTFVDDIGRGTIAALRPLGNWTTFKQDTDGDQDWDLDQSRSHNEANEIEEIDSSSTHVAHDAAGNMTKVPKPDNWSDHYTMTYDAWNRLVKVEEDDGRNRRTLKRVYSAGQLDHTRHYYYSDRWQVLEERTDTATDADRQYIWGIRYIDDLILRDRDAGEGGNLGKTGSGLDERLYALQDPNWNVIAIAESDGEIAERFAYTAYGHPMPVDPDFTTYTGPVEFEDLGAEWPPKGHLYTTAMRTNFRARYANGIELICRTQDPGFGARFEGTEGWIQYSYNKIDASPEAIKDSVIGPDELHLPVSHDHYRNFLDCVKSRDEPIEPVEVGHRTASICHAGNIAMRLKRKLQWDPAKETFVNDEQANQMLRRPYREPWRI